MSEKLFATSAAELSGATIKSSVDAWLLISALFPSSAEEEGCMKKGFPGAISGLAKACW